MALFRRLDGKQLHENNPAVIRLAEQLRRPIRGVEAQLLMFRNLERGGDYSYGHMSSLVRQTWEQERADSSAHDERAKALTDENPRLPIIDTLLNKAYGGSEVAIAPGMVAPLVSDAPAPAGVSEVIDLLVSAIEEKGPLHWVFLIGGPGNGKSHQISTVLKRLGLTPDEITKDDIALRSYEYSGRGWTLQIVNDATIRSGLAEGVGDLATDLKTSQKRARRSRHFVLANVNRGILIEEEAALDGVPGWELEQSVILWLLGRATERPLSDLEVFGSAEDFYRRARIGGATPITLHAVYLDYLSLMEPLPSEAGRAVTNIGHDNYAVAPYKVLRFEDPQRLETPAAQLLHKVVDPQWFEDAGCLRCSAQELCPMLSNARSMREPVARLGFLRVMRGAEIASGRPFTYRDWWTVVSLTVVGRKTGSLASGGHPCDWVRRQVGLLDDEARGNQALWDLARQRYYEALFADQENPFSQVLCEEDDDLLPIDKQLALVDPASDASAEQMHQVNEALSAVGFDQLPLAVLSERSHPVKSVVHTIDAYADERFTAPAWGSNHGLTPSLRAQRLAWRGRSLYRLFGLTQGIPAHAEVVGEWIETRRKARTSWAVLPHQLALRVGLDQLVFPSPEIGGQGQCLLPIFAPRVEPVRAAREDPIWCYAVPVTGLNAVTWTFMARGDALWIQLTCGQAATEFPLDFTLCREALACVCRATGGLKGELGFTEQSAFASPRLERIRATFLGKTPDEVSAWPVLVHTTTVPLSFL